MKRFAIYYTPPADAAVTRAAAAWLGRDAFTGDALGAPPLDELGPSRWEEITADPRVYGFHATLKPPFRLSDGSSEDDLREQLRKFAASRQPFEARLGLGSISRFLALVLEWPCPEFVSLAADCVREFDSFRAAPSAQELERRRKPHLNPAQLAYVTQWGYPYVMEEWRFHMSLTCSLDPDASTKARKLLATTVAPCCREPFLVDSICLFEQPAAGAPFIVRERFRFA